MSKAVLESETLPPPKKPRVLLQIDSSPTDPNKVVLTTSPPNTLNQTLVTSTLNLLSTLFSRTRVHKDRFIYALAGFLFDSSSPTPFGGPKTKPGYTFFTGDSPALLLEFIVKEIYRVQWSIKQTKALKLVVECVNRVLELHFEGEKDVVDELVLKGMKKAGHCEWFGVVRIPEYLGFVGEEWGVGRGVVEFVMPSVAMKRRVGGRGNGNTDGDSSRKCSLSDGEPVRLTEFRDVIVSVKEEAGVDSSASTLVSPAAETARLNEYDLSRSLVNDRDPAASDCHWHQIESTLASFVSSSASQTTHSATQSTIECDRND
ncbi:hypothetical protein HDU99_002456 [Rhizoclosmatium hyalinum]|nr:hypothetical protein HDU99_002456 [Rhizoclosmatium hyalinum]